MLVDGPDALKDVVMDGTDWMISNPLVDGTGSVSFRCSSPQRDPPLHKLHDSPAVRSFFWGSLRDHSRDQKSAYRYTKRTKHILAGPSQGQAEPISVHI